MPSSRGSALSRALRYFREADPDEARVAFTLVQEIMDGRKMGKSGKAPAAAAGPKKSHKKKQTSSTQTQATSTEQAEQPVGATA